MIQNKENTPFLRQEFWNLLHFNLYWAYEYQIFDKDLDLGFHSQHSYSAFWVRKGSITIRKGNKRIQATTGEWVFLPPEKLSLQIKLNTKYIYIGFSISWVGQGTLVSPLQNSVWKTEQQAILEEKALRLCQSIVDREQVKYYLYEKGIPMRSHFEFRCLFYEWVRIWLNLAEERNMSWSYIREMDERLVPIADYLKTMPVGETLDIDRLAKERGLSRPQFFRLFRKQYGTTPKQYRDQFKLQLAVQELQTTRKDIKGIATAFGYDQTQFGIWIKKHTGKTPLQVRRKGCTL